MRLDLDLDDFIVFEGGVFIMYLLLVFLIVFDLSFSVLSMG